ncbi:MAG: DUF309 domain-containing protein [Planctomycetes bacterium]|nr:DUF309 domain-containing protein [Planctomycetota bacterium]
MTPSAILNQPDDELWRRAVRCFEIRDWWMAHELLEVLWKRHPGTEAAQLYQGLLQAAVSLHHFGNGNFSGARQLARSALALLAQLPDDGMGLRIGAFRDAFDAVTRPLFDYQTPVKPLSPDDIPVL